MYVTLFQGGQNNKKSHLWKEAASFFTLKTKTNTLYSEAEA